MNGCPHTGLAMAENDEYRFRSGEELPSSVNTVIQQVLIALKVTALFSSCADCTRRPALLWRFPDLILMQNSSNLLYDSINIFTST